MPPGECESEDEGGPWLRILRSPDMDELLGPASSSAISIDLTAEAASSYLHQVLAQSPARSWISY